jgi:hypothetical protein
VYLLVVGWQEPSRGYLIDTRTALVAFSSRWSVSVLAFGLWLNDPRRGTRWAGLAALGSPCRLLQFHGGLIAQRNVAICNVKFRSGTVVTLGLFQYSPLPSLERFKARAKRLRLMGVVALVE